MKSNHFYLFFCVLLVLFSCASKPPADTGNKASLDDALLSIAAYYTENLPANTKIALVKFDSDAQLLSDYIFEELWIHFENSRAFVLVERKNLELIQKEIDYQYSGNVDDDSAQSLGKQFGAQTLIHGSITKLGREFRLVINAIDVEKAVSSIRSAVVRADTRLAALLEKPSGGEQALSMASALYSDSGNPWKFTVQTDKSDGNYRDGEYMTLRMYSERDAYFKITHIDVNGNAQVIYPVSSRDNSFIKAGETRQIPDNTRFRMSQPYGQEMILVAAYEKPFVVQPGSASPLSNNLLVRGITVEREDTHAEMRPVASAKFTYRIQP